MSKSTRLPERGPLKFNKDPKNSTEDQLAAYVLEHAEKNNPDSVVKTVDNFCWNNHWMMNLGDKKGEFVDDAIKKYKPKIILELGTYCGYSAVRMTRFLPVDGKLYTIDPTITQCAGKIIKHAGLESKIVQLQGYAEKVIPTLTQLKGKVDMVFIDHAKDKYFPDLQLIEQHGLLHPGSVVVADNTIIFHIDDYLNHVNNSGLYVTDKPYLATLEYDDTGLEERVDGIVVSVWKGNQ